jgi:hypothetical protein
METNTADKAEAPAPEVLDLVQAQEAILQHLDADEAQPVEEEATEETESQPVSEDEEVSAEDESESEDEEEYEAEDNREEEGDDDDEVFTVKVDGEDTEVSFDELLEGYSRQSDYTKKTQAVAEERKMIEEVKDTFMTEYNNLQTERQQYQQALGQLGAQLNAGIMRYQGVDWAKLKEDDPVAYVTKRDEFREEQERIQMVSNQMNAVQQQSNRDAERIHREAVVSQTRRLGELIPEWNDAEVQPKLSQNIREYALNEGYEKEEIDALIDARSVNVLLKAMRYDALQKADVKTKKLRHRPKMAKPGTKRAKSDAAKRRKAELSKQLQQSGGVKDAARLLEDLI